MCISPIALLTELSMNKFAVYPGFYDKRLTLTPHNGLFISVIDVAAAKLTGVPIKMINAESTTIDTILVLQASSTSVTSAGGDDARNSQRIRSVSSTHKVPSLSSAYETKADETNAAAAAAEEDEARRQRQMLLFVRPTKTQMLRRKFNEDKMQASINGRPSLLSTAEAPATTTVVMGIAANGNKLRAAVVDAQTAQRPTWK